MSVYHHLTHALRIMRIEPDFRRWGPLIDALPPEARDEVRIWLRQEARISKHRARAQATSPSPTRTLAEFSKTGKRR